MQNQCCYKQSLWSYVLTKYIGEHLYIKIFCLKTTYTMIYTLYTEIDKFKNQCTKPLDEAYTLSLCKI